MAVSLLDRCIFATPTAGLADWLIGAHKTGYLNPPEAGAIDGQTYYYAAQSDDLTQWELGLGTYRSSSNTFFRTSVSSSSSGGSKVNFTAAPTISIDALTALFAAIPTTSGSDGQLLIGHTASDPIWTTVTGDIGISAAGLVTIASHAVSNAKFRQSAALSVVGVAGNATADVADIAAASDGQVMRRSGAAIGFGAVDLTSANAVSGALPATKGGTGVANNAASTITISGSFGTTFTVTGTTSVTLPTAGTLATLAGSEALTNKTINGLTITSTTGTLTITTAKVLSVSNTLTLTGTDGSSAAFGTGGTVAYQGGTLAQFSATTSAQLAGVISDETGSGKLVFATSPSLTTPILGVAAATSLNKVAITAPATSATITVQDGKTLSYSEGTWTPTVSTTGTVGTPAYTTQTGFYVKTGTMVFANFSIVLSGWTGSPTGGVTIASLPIANSSTANNFGSGILFFYQVAGLAASNVGIFGSVQPGSTIMALISGGNTTTTNVTAAQAGTTAQFFGYIIYRTDS